MTLVDLSKQVSHFGNLQKVDVFDICLVNEHALVVLEVKVIIYFKRVLFQ